jgi:hypothetical protein
MFNLKVPEIEVFLFANSGRITSKFRIENYNSR